MLNVRAIKELRKISGLGVAECRRLLDITGNDVDGALALAPRSKRKPTIEHGSWYASCLRGRAGVYLFKLCADANVHNNRAL